VLFAAGLLAGVWTFVSPWVVGFPAVRPGQWSSSMWSTVWVAAIVIGVSSVGLVTALALAISAVQRPRPSTSVERDGA
jgi:hypothetical protein